MKLELNRSEIADIIAKHFHIDIDNVSVVTKTEMQGYGMCKHDEEVPVAYIEGDFIRDLSKEN